MPDPLLEVNEMFTMYSFRVVLESPVNEKSLVFLQTLLKKNNKGLCYWNVECGGKAKVNVISALFEHWAVHDKQSTGTSGSDRFVADNELVLRSKGVQSILTDTRYSQLMNCKRKHACWKWTSRVPPPHTHTVSVYIPSHTIATGLPHTCHLVISSRAKWRWSLERNCSTTTLALFLL